MSRLSLICESATAILCSMTRPLMECDDYLAGSCGIGLAGNFYTRLALNGIRTPKKVVVSEEQRTEMQVLLKDD